MSSQREIITSESLEAVRKRPGMYVGPSPDLTNFVFEAMCLALSEGHCGSCSSIAVRVDGAKFSVSDNGLGISLEVGSDGVSFAEAAMTILHACRDRGEHERVKRELCGAGLAAVNALSKSASVVSSNGERSFRQTYVQGVPQSDFAELTRPLQRGTVLTFEIDEAYLAHAVFDDAELRFRIDQAEINVGEVAISIEDVSFTEPQES